MDVIRLARELGVALQQDEEYKAFDVLFVSKDEQPIDDVDKVEKFKEAIDNEIEEINSSTEKI